MFRTTIVPFDKMAYFVIKRPIMDGFQSLRCLWKRLDKTLQYIMLKFVKSKNLTKKRPCKVFENHVTFLLPLNKTANYGWISKLKVSMKVSRQNASIYHVEIFKIQKFN